MSNNETSEIEALLAVQRLDNTLDQLRFKHANLPEREVLSGIANDLAALDRATAATEEQREGLRKQQRSLEGDASDVEMKATNLDASLYDGTVTSPKEATALGEEIASLKARQSDLEDQSIEVLLEIEPLDEQLVQAEAARGQLEASQGENQTALDASAGALDEEIAAAQSERDEAANVVTDANLELYRKMRITYGPDAVVEFDPAHNGGCPVAMSAVELDRWKHLPAGTLEPCVDCGRLVGKLA